MKTTAIALTVALFLTGTSSVYASTAAFCGTVTEAKTEGIHRDSHCSFTVKINYFDYISWGKFGRESKVGELITRNVKRLGTVCVVNGRMINAETFASTIRPGQWGYFYEDTWLNLQLTPEFQWGEVISVGDDSFVLRTHRTHKDIHLDANPPVDVTVPFDAGTSFRTNNAKCKAKDALKPGHWVQVHEPRKQTLLIWTNKANFKSSEWLPAEDGQRGFANDLTSYMALKKVSTKTPNTVTDISAAITARRVLKNKPEDVTLNAKKVTFVLDGKPAPPSIAAKAGRTGVLCHYRKEKTPHKVFVNSDDDVVRGKILEAMRNAGTVSLKIATVDGQEDFKIASDAVRFTDGKPNGEILQYNDIALYPARGRTIVSFAPQDVGE